MTIVVPDAFRSEVLNSTTEDLQDLREASQAMRLRKFSREEVAEKVKAAGWSLEFGKWYAGQLEANGPYMELVVSSMSQYDEDMQDFERKSKWKKQQFQNGLLLIGLAILLRIGLGAFANSKPPTADDVDWSLGIGWIATLVLMFKGTFMVLDSKGQSRWWWPLGLFTVLLRDKNKLFKPTQRDSSKEGDAIVSNW